MTPFAARFTSWRPSRSMKPRPSRSEREPRWRQQNAATSSSVLPRHDECVRRPQKPTKRAKARAAIWLRQLPSCRWPAQRPSQQASISVASPLHAGPGLGLRHRSCACWHGAKMRSASKAWPQTNLSYSKKRMASRGAFKILGGLVMQANAAERAKVTVESLINEAEAARRRRSIRPVKSRAARFGVSPTMPRSCASPDPMRSPTTTSRLIHSD
jgi:hypothetical protein